MKTKQLGFTLSTLGLEKLFTKWTKDNTNKIKLLAMLNKLTEKEKITLFQSVMEGKK
jgi:hypothetical protein